MERSQHSVRSAKTRVFPTAILIVGCIASFTMSALAGPLQKPDQIHKSCGDNDTYYPPDDKGAYGCLKKDGGGIACGGPSDDSRRTCDSWPANSLPPGRAPEALRAAAKKKVEKAAAEKAASEKAAAEKAAGDKAASEKAAAEKAKASKAASEKSTSDKPASDKPASDKSADGKPATGSPPASGPSAASTSTAIHDCSEVKRTCGAWAAKDKNTCRTCQQTQCKTENGKDVLAGNKTQTECYEGHGPPP
jgi:hypothetical protein